MHRGFFHTSSTFFPFYHTSQHSSHTFVYYNSLLQHTPIPRMATAQEMADAAVYFATAEFTTGQIMGIHGGFGIPTPVYGDTMNMALKR